MRWVETYLSISLNSSSTRWSWGTFLSGLPREKIRPSLRAPGIPKSACEASPMPLTAQPRAAAPIGAPPVPLAGAAGAGAVDGSGLGPRRAFEVAHDATIVKLQAPHVGQAIR